MHNSVKMYCDSANDFSNEHYFDAFGNIRIKQGDSILLTARFENWIQSADKPWSNALTLAPSTQWLYPPSRTPKQAPWQRRAALRTA